MKQILYLIIIVAALFSCEPPEVGYISDNIHSLQDTIFVPRGVFMTSTAPSAEGSTYPMHWEITSVTDEAGNPTDDLFTPYEILIWEEAFNPLTDTTLALAEEKLVLSEEPSLLINHVSGQMGFTQASKFVEGNDIYKVGVSVSNVKGERQLDDFTVLKLGAFEPALITGNNRVRIYLIKNDGGKHTLLTKYVNPGDDNVQDVFNGTHPYLNITKTSDEPTLGVKSRLVVTDSYGVVLGSETVVPYPYQGGYLTTFSDNSVETVVDPTGTTFMLPAPPFPQYDKNGWGMYYLSRRDVFAFDKEAYEADFGPKDWSEFQVDPTTGDLICEVNTRWNIQINDSGTWEMKMLFPYTKKIQ
ncbi:hypothetical protein [Carboxylicivirga marina]|uniref:hypothetical protein n=1 Tax=Carboxylicivirga marina TaxID=2800988 RepID=UPI002593E1A8|nr:hypothetical protein [uncultured Carboxylicivirga sp.]